MSDKAVKVPTVDAVRDLIADVLERPLEHIGPTANVIDDLGADSLDMIEIGNGLEDRFNISIEPRRLRDVETPEQLAALVDTILEESHAA